MGARRALLLNHAYVSQLFGLVVWFLLWLREVPGSIPASCAPWRLLAPRGAAGHFLAALSLAAPGASWHLLAPPGASWRLLAPLVSWRLLELPGASWRFLALPGASSDCFLRLPNALQT